MMMMASNSGVYAYLSNNKDTKNDPYFKYSQSKFTIGCLTSKLTYRQTFALDHHFQGI